MRKLVALTRIKIERDYFRNWSWPTVIRELGSTEEYQLTGITGRNIYMGKWEARLDLLIVRAGEKKYKKIVDLRMVFENLFVM